MTNENEEPSLVDAIGAEVEGEGEASSLNLPSQNLAVAATADRDGACGQYGEKNVSNKTNYAMNELAPLTGIKNSINSTVANGGIINDRIWDNKNGDSTSSKEIEGHHERNGSSGDKIPDVSEPPDPSSIPQKDGLTTISKLIMSSSSISESAESTLITTPFVQTTSSPEGGSNMDNNTSAINTKTTHTHSSDVAADAEADPPPPPMSIPSTPTSSADYQRRLRRKQHQCHSLSPTRPPSAVPPPPPGAMVVGSPPAVRWKRPTPPNPEQSRSRNRMSSRQQRFPTATTMFPSDLVAPDSAPQFEFVSSNLRRIQSTPIPVSPPGNPEKQGLVLYHQSGVPANPPFPPTDTTATQTATSATNTRTQTNMALSRPRPVRRMISAPPSSSSAMSDYERRAQRKRGQMAAVYGSPAEDSETATTLSLISSTNGPLTPGATRWSSALMTVGHQSLPDLEELYKPDPPESVPQFEFVSSNPLRRIQSTPTPVFPPGERLEQQLGSYNQVVVSANPPCPPTETATALTGTSTTNTTTTLSHPGPGPRTLSVPMTDYERRAQRKRGQMAAMYGNNEEDSAPATTLRLASSNNMPLTPPLPSATAGTSAPMTVPIVRQSLPDLEEPREHATTSPPPLSETTVGWVRRIPPPRTADNVPPTSIDSYSSSGSLGSFDGSADELTSVDGASRGSRDRVHRRRRRRRQEQPAPSSDDDTVTSFEFGIEGNVDIDNASTPSPWGMGTSNASASNLQQSHQSRVSDATWYDDDTVGELLGFATGSNHRDHNHHDFQLPPMSADHDSTMPGAFHARGRAIGEYPAWGRHGGAGDRTTNPEGTPPPNDNRRSLQRSGSSIRFLRSNLLSRLSSRWLLSLGIHQHDVGVVEARLVSEVESTESLSANPPNVNAHQSVHGEMEVFEADKVVTDESIRLKHERFCLLSMLACLALVLIMVVVILRFTIGALRPGHDDGMDTDNPGVGVGNFPIVKAFPTNETIAHEEWCGGFEEDFATVHSPVVQCLCTGNLEIIPAATLMSFHGFIERLDAVGVFDSARSNTYGHPNGTSCDDPRNGALYWLAEEDPGFSRYSKQTLVERYSLAVLFMSTMGMKWKEQTSWLTQMDVCDWGGITCHNLDEVSSRDVGGLIMSIDLSNHGLSGIIPPDLAFLVGLEVLNLAGNVELVGTVPATFAELDRLSTLDIRGTSVEVVNELHASLSQAWCVALPNVTVEADCGMACDCCRENC